MSKITYAFMQRYTHNLDNAIKNFVTTKMEAVTEKTKASADGVITGYTASNDITVSKMVVTTVGSIVTVMVGFSFNSEPNLESDKILISGFPVPKGEVAAVAVEQDTNTSNNLYLNLSGNLMSRVGIYGTGINWVGFTYIKA